MASASCCARPRAPPPLSRSPPSASPCRRPCARSQTPDPQPKSAMSCHGLAAARVCVPCQWLGFADCRRSVKEGIQPGGSQDGVAVLAGGNDSDLEPVTAEVMNELDASIVGLNPCVLDRLVDQVILAVSEPAHCFDLRRVVWGSFWNLDIA